MGYLIKNNSKSLNILFPLVSLKEHEKLVAGKQIKTYCFWDHTSEGIEEYQLLVLFNLSKDEREFEKYNEKVITPNVKLVNCYDTDKGNLFVFDLIGYKSDIDKFLDGKYSKLSESTKRQIFSYWGEIDKEGPCSLAYDKPSSPRHVFLRPEYYFEEVAKELGYTDGGEYLRSVGELWSKPDTRLVEEVIDGERTGRLINGNETLTCEIITSCIDYNQLTLGL